MTELATRRVLVVDDNVDSAETLGMLLVAKGQEVETAHDGPGALEKAEEFKPDVVLLDIGLPGMSGYDVARELRRRAPEPRPYLLALTGFGRDEDRQRAEEAGFDDHLLKPVDVEALLERLGSLSS